MTHGGREPKHNPNVLAGMALLCYVVCIAFGVRLVWEALIGPAGATLPTTAVMVTLAVSGTVYLALALRSDR